MSLTLPQHGSPVPIDSAEELNRLFLSEALEFKQPKGKELKLQALLTNWGLFLADSPLVNWETMVPASITKLWPDDVEQWAGSTEGHCALFSHEFKTTVQLSIFHTTSDKALVFLNLRLTSPKSQTLASVAITKSGITDSVRVSGMGVEEAFMRPDLRSGDSLVTVIEMLKKIPLQIQRQGYDPFYL